MKNSWEGKFSVCRHDSGYKVTIVKYYDYYALNEHNRISLDKVIAIRHILGRVGVWTWFI